MLTMKALPCSESQGRQVISHVIVRHGFNYVVVSYMYIVLQSRDAYIYIPKKWRQGGHSCEHIPYSFSTDGTWYSGWLWLLFANIVSKASQGLDNLGQDRCGQRYTEEDQRFMNQVGQSQLSPNSCGIISSVLKKVTECSYKHLLPALSSSPLPLPQPLLLALFSFPHLEMLFGQHSRRLP